MNKNAINLWRVSFMKIIPFSWFIQVMLNLMNLLLTSQCKSVAACVTSLTGTCNLPCECKSQICLPSRVQEIK